MRLACVCCAFTVAFAAPAEKPDKARELRELRERIEKLQRDLVTSEESRSEAADALSASEKSISEANRNLAMLSREQARISQSLAELKRAADEAKADAARQQDLLGRLIRHQYMHGNTDGLRLLLDGQDVGEVERRMRYLGYVSRMRADLIARLKQNAANLAELESTTRQQQQELMANADAQRKARAALQTERHVRQKLFARIKGDIAKGRREIGRLKRDEDRLGKLVEQLAKAIAKNRDQRRSEGKSEGKSSGVPKKGVLIEHVADASLAGLHIFFPDPWPKKRHHKRRLIQAEFVKLLTQKLAPGGYLHLATDWEDYAHHMMEVLGYERSLRNAAGEGFAPRPEYRGSSSFERKGLAKGHDVWDLVFVRN